MTENEASTQNNRIMLSRVDSQRKGYNQVSKITHLEGILALRCYISG